MLTERYSVLTLLAFLSALQRERKRMDEAIGFVTLHRSDAESAVQVYLEIFLEAMEEQYAGSGIQESQVSGSVQR